ncbi:hypothetical protein KJ891_02605, partial [Candidatus Micrarchaeota archaeon]|nr:hypothetical protein [Candidatus Micrarchaeota archaeon]
VHEKSVRVLMKYDSLPVVKMGGKYYFSRQDTLNKTQRADLIRRVRAAEGEHRAYKRQRKLLKPKLSGLGQELLKKHGEANGKLVKDFVGLLEAGIRMFGRDITPSKARKFALRAGDSRDLRRSYERLQRAFNALFTSAAEAKKIQKRIADTINRDADPNSKR